MALTMRTAFLQCLAGDNIPFGVQEDITVEPIIVYGAYYRMDIRVSDTDGIEGKTYLFNPTGIARTPAILPLITDTGFKISIQSGVPIISMESQQGNSIVTITNYKISVVDVNPDDFVILFDFYAGEEFSFFMSTFLRTNKEILLSTRALSNTILDNTIISAWNNQKAYLQYSLYSVNDNAFVTNTDTNSPYGYYTVHTKFIDEDTEGNNLWNGSNYSFNALQSMSVVYSSSVGTYSIIRKAPPFYSRQVDSNFQVNGSQINPYLRLTNIDNIKFDIRTPDFTPNRVIVRIIRTDEGAFTDMDLFTTEYDLRQAFIPNSTAPAPNPITYPVFSTPSGMSTSGGVTVVSLHINGIQLQPNANYRIFVYLYKDSAFKFQSVHVSPEFVTMDINPPTITSSVTTQTYNASFTNASPLNLSVLDRYKCILSINANNYSRGLTNFTDEFKGVEIKRTIGSYTETSYYNFVDGVSTSNPIITMTSSMNEYFFTIYYNPINLLSNATIEYRLLFSIPLNNGTLWDIALKLPNQSIVMKPVNDGYIQSLEFLDYNTNETTTLICTDESNYVWLKAKQAVTQNANVIANIVIGYNTIGALPAITEEESYASSYLPIENSVHLQNIPVQFDANGEAKILINTSLFPSNSSIIYAFVTAIPF